MQVEAALYHLNLIELSMNNPKNLFGLRALNDHERSITVGLVRALITALVTCVNEMKQQVEIAGGVAQLRRECTKVCRQYNEDLL